MELTQFWPAVRRRLWIALALTLVTLLASTVITLVQGSEYKRRQAAPGIIVTKKAFGIGRRMPIAQKWRE